MARNWYSIENKAGSKDSVEISIYGPIGATWDGEGTTAPKFIEDLAVKASGAKNIDLYMSSPGGSLFDGIAIHNALAMHGASITGKVMGVVASAASYIMLACSTVEMPKNTFQMVHNISSGMWGTAAEMQQWVDTMNKIDTQMQATYAARTGKTTEEIALLLSKDTWLTAEDCLAMGLCDTVTDSIAVTAKYEPDALPDNVRQALGWKSISNVVTPPAVEAAVDQPSLSDQISAAFAKAELSQFAPHFALKLVSMDAVPKAIADAREIVALCKTAGKPERATGFVTSETTLADVRSTLVNERAAADEQLVVDTARKTEASATEDTQRAAVTPMNVYDKRRKQLAQSATNLNL